MGGTFNPIHYGHLVAAEAARCRFELDKIIFMPTGHPSHKEDQDMVAAEDRYLMTVIATATNPRFEVSRLEVDRPGATYTIDTVRELRQQYGVEEIFFITGADAVWEILAWKQSELLSGFCRFIAATRPGYALENFKDFLHENPGLPVVDIMEVTALAISSTDLRFRVKQGEPIRYLLPEPVENFIYKSGFYL